MVKVSVSQSHNIRWQLEVFACAKHLLFHPAPDVIVIKNPPANAGDIRDFKFNPWVKRPPQVGHGNPLQCF